MITKTSALVFAMVLFLSPGRAGDSKKDLAALQGVWKLEAVESDGAKQELVRKPPRWVIKANKVFYGGEELAVLTLDPAAKPKIMDIAFSKGKGTFEGVYSLSKDTLKVCVNKKTEGVKERPVGFDTKDKPDWRLMVFKRLREPDAGDIKHLSGFAGIAIGFNKEKELIIGTVLENTPAQKAGLKKDDIILQVGGQDVTDLRTTVRMIGEFQPGSEVAFRIKRGGKEQDIKVKVGVLPFFYLD
jgi:uncharacterized protein (TIGR03067 family)